MRIRLFGKEIYLSKPVKIIGIAVFLAAVTALGFFIDHQAKKGAAFTEVLAGTQAPAGNASPGSGAPQQGSTPGTPEETGTAGPMQTASPTDPPAPATPEKVFLIYIVGEVNSPDVYALPPGSILLDLVQAAGGFTENADREAVNLAYPLQNNMMVRIPSQNDPDKSWLFDKGQNAPAENTASQGSSAPQSPQKVNINTAGLEELCTLPGIGESMAQKIIAYRTENGAFQSIEDIMKVSGIKGSRYEQLKERITV